MKVHHIGYAVRDIKKSYSLFKHLGFCKIGDVIEDESRDVKIILLRNDNVLVELISPLSIKSPVYRIIEKNNNTPYHICFCTDSIHKEIEVLRKNNYLLLESPKPAIAFNGRKVSFLYNEDIGLIELIECK